MGEDSYTSVRLLELSDRLHDARHSVIISTHDGELALSWADHVSLMCQGVLIVEGSPEIVFSEEQNLRDGHLAQSIVPSAYMRLRELGALSKDVPAPRTAAHLTELVASHAGTGGVEQVERLAEQYGDMASSA
ncbi:MAG: hypothetical protein OXG46_11350 [Chloroflexi bacterium]|nr:hypothetical protein [Chloroflexota bacterium]MCY3937987.1 hypothetical protein [Chloroflexota bacterium]